MAIFGQERWPFEASGPRYLKKETVPVPNTIGVNVDFLYSVSRGRLSVSLQTNVPLSIWNDNDSSEIRDAVRDFLKIKDYSDVDVRADPSDLLARLDFRRHSEPINHFLMHHR